MPTTSLSANKKFLTAQTAALRDGRVDKAEARQLRALALKDLKQHAGDAATAARYGDTFARLLPKADPKAKNYVTTVSDEFKGRSRYQEAATALAQTLRAKAGTLPKALANIDLSQPFEVGTTMNRGLFLRVELKDRGLYFESTQAAERLFKSTPALREFGDIYVIS